MTQLPVAMKWLICVLLLLIAQTSSKSQGKKSLKVSFPKTIIPQQDTHTRIFGGSKALDGQFPYMAFMYIALDYSYSLCSASLISESHVILAAHCFISKDPNKDTVFLAAGRSNVSEYIKARASTPLDKGVNEAALSLQERKAEKIYIPVDYSTDTYEHDIALIRTASPFIMSSTVQTIPISKERFTESQCIILGWGYSENNIQSYELAFAKNLKAKALDSVGCTYKDSGPFICIEKVQQGICQGDSGSPLVCNGEVWGVASHLVGDSNQEQATCGEDLEEYYAALYPELDWIDQTISQTFPRENDKGSSNRLSLQKIYLIIPLMWIISCINYM